MRLGGKEISTRIRNLNGNSLLYIMISQRSIRQPHVIFMQQKIGRFACIDTLLVNTHKRNSPHWHFVSTRFTLPLALCSNSNAMNRTWFLSTYCVRRVPPVTPICPPVPVPLIVVAPTSGFILSAASLGRPSKCLLLPLSSRKSGSACGLWMTRGACNFTNINSATMI